MAREIDQEDISMDMTSMIDVVFLLIIFFILMPPKEMEGQLESYLPKSGGSASSPSEEEPDVKFFLTLRSSLDGEQVFTQVTFNNRPICNFETLSISALDQIYAMPKGQKQDRLAKEHERDEKQFHPQHSKKLADLINIMVEASKGAPKGLETDVMIDSSSNVPFKVVLAVLNAGTGANFKNLKFAAPDKSIWAKD